MSFREVRMVYRYTGDGDPRDLEALMFAGCDDLCGGNLEDASSGPAKDYEEPPALCSGCGKEAAGMAFVGDLRYCHPDDGPSCYMRAISGRA